MARKHRKIDVEDAIAGMVLADPVLDAHGGILLPREATLTDALLTSLRRRGIDVISVVNDEISEEELQAERNRVQHRTTVLFRKAAAGSATEILMKRVLEYRLEELK